MGKSKEQNPASYTLRISENALCNLDEITGYIAFVRHQPQNAIHVGEMFFDTIRRIQKNPLAFRECDEIPTSSKIYRKAVCLSWLIIYKIKSDVITVLGVIHGSRRPSKISRLRRRK
ncbi:MAG: type II toxin-antitoxin system RelE/ParE family toxin [Bacteroidales bacterium]|nr:type II toxin-antitoxin system RelE/ParE family toxin [Bacteroidales bacterium]